VAAAPAEDDERRRRLADRPAAEAEVCVGREEGQTRPWWQPVRMMGGIQ
jgi:hypothetical protein